MKILQIVTTLKLGDAIGNYSIMLHRRLKDSGLEAYLYAQNAIGGAGRHCTGNEILNQVEEDDVVVYQMCQSSEMNEFITDVNCKKIAIYHNITPSDFFSQYSIWMKSVQQAALEEISKLNNVFDRVIADSEFNKADLIQMGYRNDIDVIPIGIDFRDYDGAYDEETNDRYSDDYFNILFVGRLAPNKKQEDVIRAFAYYKKNVNKESRLILVGSPFCEDYYHDLVAYVNSLGIADVIVTGGVSFSEIVSYYRCADVFLCMSEHEGFCVPIVESMYFSVPIIAYNSTAVGQTMGDGGLLIGDKDPKFVSACIEEIRTNDNLRETLIYNQRKMLELYSGKNTVDKTIEVIKQVAFGYKSVQ